MVITLYTNECRLNSLFGVSQEYAILVAASSILNSDIKVYKSPSLSSVFLLLYINNTMTWNYKIKARPHHVWHSLKIGQNTGMGMGVVE